MKYFVPFQPFTVCQRSFDPFYIVAYCIKWVKRSWTYNTYQLTIMFLALGKQGESTDNIFHDDQAKIAYVIRRCTRTKETNTYMLAFFLTKTFIHG